MFEAGVIRELESTVVVFGDLLTGETVEFQVGEEDAQDAAQRLTGVCVVVNGGAACAYQAVESWTIEDAHLNVILTQAAAATLCSEHEFNADLAGLPNRVDVEAALREVLSGHFQPK